MSMTIFNFALIKGLRNLPTLVFNCILPIALLLIRPMWTGEGALGFLSGFGILAMIVWGGAFLMAQGIMNDKNSGALTRILAGPVSMFQYLTQNLLAFMVPLTLQITIISILGMVLYDWSRTLALAVFICYTIFTMTSVTMSFAWNCLFKSKDASFQTFGAVITFGTFLSGAMVPLELLPSVLQYVGAIFPAYWGIRGINAFLSYDTMGLDYWMGIGAMLLFTLVFLLYGGKRRMI